MKPRSWAIPVALGFFALQAQTVLFRDFLAAFEGHELGVGVFFGSWLLWIAAGAFGAARFPKMAAFLPALTLLYIPAEIAQHLAIGGVRAWAGIASYELFPFGRLAAWSLVVNAPVSLMTGALFTWTCSWYAQRLDRLRDAPAAVYVLETLGGSLGGLAVTACLAGGMDAQTVMLLGMAVLAGGVFWAGDTRGQRHLSGIVLLIMLCLLGCGNGPRWADIEARRAWSRLLPPETYLGRFATAQAAYSFGEREGQFLVLSGGSVVESFPGGDESGELAALVLSQQPETRRVFATGEGALGLCARLRALPQIEQAVWGHPDAGYPLQLARVLPHHFSEALRGLKFNEEDLRTHLRGHEKTYDAIVLGWPDLSTLAHNRYATLEFFTLAKRALRDGGVALVRIPGGANYVGGELASIGASAMTTFGSVFPRVAMKPGDATWLIGSESAELSESPALLRERFAGVPGTAQAYPPEGLLSMFPPDRIAFQREAYARIQAQTGTQPLLNTDDRPKALLYALLLLLRQVGFSGLVGLLPVFAPSAAILGLAACGILIATRVTYVIRARRSEGVQPLFDGFLLAGSTGACAMALSIVILFIYQARYGTLFLHIGLLSAVFMFGSFLGGHGARKWLARERDMRRGVWVGGTVAVLTIILCVASLPDFARPIHLGLMILAAGACTGVFFPVAAEGARRARWRAGATGAALEAMDHLGAAAGALATGLVLLPCLGQQITLALLAMGMAANLPAVLWMNVRLRAFPAPDRVLRPLAYAATGLAAWGLVASNAVSYFAERQQSSGLEPMARAMAGDTTPQARSTTLMDGGASDYFSIGPPETPEAYIIDSGRLAPKVTGYGGRLGLAVRLRPDGVLEDARFLRNRETPSYLEPVRAWLSSLAGRDLFAPKPFEGVDAVSGATITSRAVLESLQVAGHRFGGEVLGVDVGGPPEMAAHAPEHRGAVALLLFFLGAVVLRFRSGPWRRRIYLAASAVVLGIWLNTQYSAYQVFALLSLDVPPMALTAGFLTVVGIPLATLLLGNVYCGYVCPFGALQELAGEFRPAYWRTEPRKPVGRWGRWIKYALLLLLALMFALTRDRQVLDADVLGTLFSPLSTPEVLGAAVFLVALSVPYKRFWCRNLCPAGAFLALLGHLQPLGRFFPKPKPYRCDLGVAGRHELDCLCCDRCLFAKSRFPDPEGNGHGTFHGKSVRRIDSTSPLIPLRRGIKGDVLLEKVPSPFPENPITTWMGSGSLKSGTVAPALPTAIIERRYLILAVACGLIFVAATLSHTGEAIAQWQMQRAGGLGAAGKARTVDLQQIRDRTEQGQLSNHEALYYKPDVEGPP